MLKKDLLLEKFETLNIFNNINYDNFNQFKLSIYIRGVEEAVVALAKERILRGPIHSYVGEEAVATGILSNSLSNDAITSTHRGHGHYIAKGGNITNLINELHGRRDGCNGGHGGSMHVADLSINHFGANGIVGGGVPIACGIALSLKIDKSKSIVFCFFGDGASNQGVVLESFNIAAFLNLPILFICENNQYAQSTKLTDISKTSVSKKAKGFGIESCEVDGLNIDSVSQVSKEMVEFVRQKSMPFLIQANTYRFHRHFVSERPKEIDYLDEKLHSDLISKDPLLQYCFKNKLNIAELETNIKNIKEIVIEYSMSLNK